MTDISKLKKLKGRRGELGVPPTLDEASLNLTAPEFAPVGIAEVNSPPLPQVQTMARKIDGRSFRRSKRTVQFATRVTPEWDTRIRTIAQREGVLLIDVLEKALDAYEKKYND